MEDIILLGCGGHAESVVDAIECEKKYYIRGFLDDLSNQHLVYRGYSVLGDDTLLEELYQSGIKHAFVCVGFLGEGLTRKKLYNQLKSIGFTLPSVIDPTCAKALDVKIGQGVFVGKNSVINSNADIDDMVIVNSGAIIEHDCKIGKFTHISVGSVLCGGVSIGERSFVGANATILQGIEIGNDVIVGAASLVLGNVSNNSKVTGIIKKV